MSMLLPTSHQYKWASSTQDHKGPQGILRFLFGSPVRCLISFFTAISFLVLALISTSKSIDPIKSFDPYVWIPHSNRDGLENLLGPIVPKDEGFTIVAPTYHRNDILPEFLKRYATGDIPSLRKIIIVWQDQENRPPQWLIDLVPTFQVPTVIRESRQNALSERFRPDPQITTDGVLNIDDDILFEPKYVEAGYQAWKMYGGGRKRMVGYVPREVSPDLQYKAPAATYSMVLTKAAFIHNDWLQGYWSEEYKELREYVDKGMNCEDILISFLYGTRTEEAPIYFQAPFDDKGGAKGIWRKPGHFEKRSACVKHFAEELGNVTLPKNSIEMKLRV